MRIRVCHFAASPGLGRGEFYVDLANELSRRGDVEVTLLIPHDALFRDRISPTVQILEYKGGRSRRNPFFLFEITRTLRDWKPDIVHTHFAKASEVFYTIRRRIRTQWVASKHNPRPGPIFEKVPHVIAVSREVAENLKRKDARVIYNGIPIRAGTAPLSRARNESDVIRLLSVGRLEPVKGYDRLIRELAKTNLNWRLRIAGDGTQREALQSLASQLGVSTRVELLGFRSDIPQLLEDCDIYIQSSRSEGFGIALIEAMQFAPLVISTRTGIAAEVFPDWLLWNPEEQGTLDSILRDRNALSQKFLKWAPSQLVRFDLATAAEEHVRFYDEICAKATLPE